MHIDEHQDWMDGFDTWEEVWSCLPADWARVVDVRQRLEVERELDDLLVVEVGHGRLRARQRRELHRLGFRPTTSVRVTVWRWEVGPAALPDAWPQPHQLLRTRMLTEELITKQAQAVVQEVLRSSPRDVVVVLHREPDLWDDGWEDDEDEQSSTG